MASNVKVPGNRKSVNAGATVRVGNGSATMTRRELTARQMQIIGNRREAVIHNASNRLASPRDVLGSTQDGCDWAMAALDPCSPEAPMSVGLPDTITAAVVTPGYRQETSISWDTTMFNPASDADGMTSWGVQVVRPPIAEIAFMYRLHNETNDKYSRWRVIRVPGFSSVPNASSESGYSFRTGGYNKYRIIGSGSTMELDAPDIANQGRVVSGQVEPSSSMLDHAVEQYKTPSGTAQPGPGQVFKEFHLNVLATKNALVSLAPRVYQGEAKNGVYIIHKFDGPLMGYDFVETGSDGIVRNAAISGQSAAVAFPDYGLTMSVEDLVTDQTSSYAHFVPSSAFTPALGSGELFGVSAISPDEVHPFISPPCRLLTSITFFEGLAGAIAGVASTPTIRVKSRTFYECLAGKTASIAAFAHPAPLWDPRAIENTVMVMQTYDDAYPASYNGFGDILGTIWSGLKSVGSVVGNVWNNVIKPVGDVIETGVGLAALA